MIDFLYELTLSGKEAGKTREKTRNGRQEEQK